ncbi:MAG: thiol reductant ABC exporter subunit CydC [Pelovirga sp.]
MKDLIPFLRLLRPHRDWIIWAIFFGCLTLFASIGLLALSGWFLSASAVAGLSIAAAQNFNIFTPSAGIRGFAVMRTAGRYIERLLSHEATLRLLSSLRVWFYRRIEPQAPAGLYRHRSGDLLNRIVTDIDTLDGLFIRVVLPSLVALFVAGLVSVFLWWLAPLLVLVFLLFYLTAGVFLPLLSHFLGQQTGAAIQHQLATLRANLLEDLHGMADLTIYGGWQYHNQARRAENEVLLKLQEKMAVIQGFNSAMLTVVAGVAALAALYVAIPPAQGGAFDGALLALIAFGILAAFEAVVPLPAAYQMLGKISSAAQRIRTIADGPVAVTFPEKPTRDILDSSVRYNNVDFRYPGNRQAAAVRAINLDIKQQTSLAIVGPSGCGKTTLAHLLTRFWDPDQGIITVGGEPLLNFSEAQLRQLVTLVSQKSHIFNATLRDNLLIGARYASDNLLWEALKKAQLDHFVAGLPHQLDTWAGEGGARLSGGETRRLVLARALLKDAPIWVLDEPTEGLDNHTRRQFNQTLFANLQGKTAIFITHTTDVLERVEQVCFMEAGQIIACGDHDELLAGSERYRHFINSYPG